MWPFSKPVKKKNAINYEYVIENENQKRLRMFFVLKPFTDRLLQCLKCGSDEMRYVCTPLFDLDLSLGGMLDAVNIYSIRPHVMVGKCKSCGAKTQRYRPLDDDGYKKPDEVVPQ